MRILPSSEVRALEEYAFSRFGTDGRQMIANCAAALAECVRREISEGGRVIILCGPGNNGADGYALAAILLEEKICSPTVLNVFGKTPTGADCRFYYDKCEAVCEILTPEEISDLNGFFASADCIVDAIFGTGARGEIPEALSRVAMAAAAAEKPLRIAVDFPLGISAESGEVFPGAIRADMTLSPLVLKWGQFAPAAVEYIGKLIPADLGLPMEQIAEEYGAKNIYFGEEECRVALPKRKKTGNKGDFGKLLLICGSEKYPGAADLSLSAALRGGCGYCCYLGTEKVAGRLLKKYPEALYRISPPLAEWTEEQIGQTAAFSDGFSAIVIGPGLGRSDALRRLLFALLRRPGGTLVIDADAINSLSDVREEAKEAIRAADRGVILTPHPLEFSRLTGKSVAEIEADRPAAASEYAEESGAIVLLKGARTIISAGERVLVNSSGSDALAKAGSGDVLAGLVGSLAAMGTSPESAAACAAYLHGRAGEELAKIYSSFGVTPSDLPKEIARQIAVVTRRK